jgi:hypothetical protein
VHIVQNARMTEVRFYQKLDAAIASGRSSMSIAREFNIRAEFVRKRRRNLIGSGVIPRNTFQDTKICPRQNTPNLSP